MSSINRAAVAGKRSRLGGIGQTLYRLCRSWRGSRPLILTWPKWQMKFVGDFRPEFPGYVPRHIGSDAHPGSFSYGAEATFVAGMIEIAQSFGAGGPEPFGVVGHQVAGIAMGYKGVAQGVSESLLEAAMPQAVIAGILLEN